MIRKNSLYQKKFNAGDRNYSFEVRESRIGKPYLVISEEGNGKRHNLIIFEDLLRDFYREFQQSCSALIRESRARHPRPWDRTCEKRLKQLFDQGFSVPDIAHQLKRSPEDILTRLVKLGELSPDEAGISR